MENNVETTSTEVKKSNDTHSYKGWLNSDSFLKRSFAIWGYHFVANLIISIISFVLGGIIVAFIGFSLFSLFSSFAPMGEIQNNIDSQTFDIEGIMEMLEQ